MFFSALSLRYMIVNLICFPFRSLALLYMVLKPMALEQVLSDRDSEDEVDDDIADLEDRRVS